MLFRDFLKATVLICAGAATLLATSAVISVTRRNDFVLVLIGGGWWIVAGIYGAIVGRRRTISSPIGELLATAEEQPLLQPKHPGRILLNRLWPILFITLVADGLAFFAPQVPGIAAGFATIWALSWRHQESAVTALEDRDGVQFYVKPTAPFRAMALVRTPALKRDPPRSGA